MNTLYMPDIIYIHIYIAISWMKGDKNELNVFCRCHFIDWDDHVED